MGFSKSNGLIFGQPEPGMLAMWGSAAWAQTQLTPGVSVLAAPRSSIRPRPSGGAKRAHATGRRNPR